MFSLISDGMAANVWRVHAVVPHEAKRNKVPLSEYSIKLSTANEHRGHDCYASWVRGTERLLLFTNLRLLLNPMYTQECSERVHLHGAAQDLLNNKNRGTSLTVFLLSKATLCFEAAPAPVPSHSNRHPASRITRFAQPTMLCPSPLFSITPYFAPV